MKYVYIEPEVAGGLGARTVMDRTVHPPIVSKLHYQMEGWPEDAILESFPVFIVTQDARQGLLASGLTGVIFAEVEVTTTDTFRKLYPYREIPRFAWLKSEGRAGFDDFGTATDGRLVVSERALGVLRQFGAAHALVEPFDA